MHSSSTASGANTATSASSASLALRTMLDDDPADLSPGEAALLSELLDRLSSR